MFPEVDGQLLFGAAQSRTVRTREFLPIIIFSLNAKVRILIVSDPEPSICTKHTRPDPSLGKPGKHYFFIRVRIANHIAD
jgi:hypothetical protein